MDQENKIEFLELSKEEEEKEIKDLNAFIEKLEIIKNQMPSFSIINIKANAFIKELSKEIEYKDFLIQELTDSINFEDSKKE